MKNLKIVILGISIIGICFSGNIFADSDIKNEEKNLSQDYINYLNLSDEEKQKLEIIPEEYDVDYDDFFSRQSKYNISANAISLDGDSNIPTTFDLRDKFEINVESQGLEGNCWIFATLGAMRTHLALKNSLSVTPNLSERHLDYLTSTLYSNKGILRSQGTGGNFSYALRYFMNNDGPVLETRVPYSSSYSTAAELKALDDMNPDYYVHKTIAFPTIKVKQGNYYNGDDKLTDDEVINFRNQVKEHIMTNGGVYCSIRVNSKFADNYNNRCNQFDDGTVDGSECTGHALTIIGWDDNYSRDNFYGEFKPQKDGAWLVLNSYGKNWAENGFQWVSYEDYHVNAYISGFESVDTTSKTVSQKFSNENVYYVLKNYYTSYKYPVTGDDSQNYLSMPDLIDNMNIIQTIYLSNLKLNDEDVKQLSTFSFSNISTLDLSSNNITDITPISKYNNAKLLDISYNTISDIEAVGTFFNLNTLNAEKNLIDNIDCLSSLQNLEEVYLGYNKIPGHSLTNSKNYLTLKMIYQTLTYDTKLANENYYVEYPNILERAKDKNDQLYDSEGIKYVGCKESKDGKGILVDKTADEVYVSINSGNASGTKFSITNYDKLKKGDINKDGKIDLLDVFLSYNKYLKSSISEASWEDSILADLNSDSKIDLLDVFLDYNKYLKECNN